MSHSLRRKKGHSKGRGKRRYEEFCCWFSGFTAGEGCFRIRNRTVRYGGKSVIYPQPALTISLRLDDAKILKHSQKVLGCGSGRDLLKCRKGKNPLYVFEITKLEDLVKIIIPIFDRFKMHPAKKHEDYLIWRRAVMAMWDRRGENKRIRWTPALVWFLGRMKDACSKAKEYNPRANEVA